MACAVRHILSMHAALLCCDVLCFCIQQVASLQPVLLAELSVPGNAGRAYGALTADRNPIHLSSITSQV
jgi:hypothetical protein